ncbi:hypothetical protein Hanom_Chr10g00964721 [Helianthus anomalus]
MILIYMYMLYVYMCVRTPQQGTEGGRNGRRIGDEGGQTSIPSSLRLEVSFFFVKCIMYWSLIDLGAHVLIIK